jgi:hypothetical protein
VGILETWSRALSAHDLSEAWIKARLIGSSPLQLQL